MSWPGGNNFTFYRVTNQGKVRFMIYAGGITPQRLILFMRRLTKDARRKVFLILDNLNVHKSRLVKDWLVANAKRIEVFYLPPYSPDLNPIELAISKIKTVLRTLACRTVDGLFDGIGEALDGAAGGGAGLDPSRPERVPELTVVGQGAHLRLEFADLRHEGTQPLQIAVVLGAEDLGE